jgi:hypothetical protein
LRSFGFHKLRWFGLVCWQIGGNASILAGCHELNYVWCKNTNEYRKCLLAYDVAIGVTTDLQRSGPSMNSSHWTEEECAVLLLCCARRPSLRPVWDFKQYCVVTQGHGARRFSSQYDMSPLLAVHHTAYRICHLGNKAGPPNSAVYTKRCSAAMYVSRVLHAAHNRG